MSTYYEKYLKYKSKYNLLKSQLGGRTVTVHDKKKKDQTFQIELDKGDDIMVLKAQMLSKLSDRSLNEDDLDFYSFRNNYCSPAKLNDIDDNVTDVCLNIKQKINAADFIPQRITSGFKSFIIDIKDRVGKFKLTHDGTIFEGTIHQGKMDHGQFVRITKGSGKVITPENDQYIGEFYENYLIGTGKIIYSNGNIKEGEFINGKLNGQGKIIDKVQNVYSEGTFKNDELDGEGKIIHDGGLFVLEGIFKDNKLSKGTITDPIVIQSGDFNHLELINGKKLFKESGNYDEGEFTNGKLTKGTSVLNGFNVRKGTFIDGKLNGDGSLKDLTNNILYIGTFVNDKLKQGMMKVPSIKLTHLLNTNLKDHILYEGSFENNLLNGKGKVTYENGRVEEGEYFNGLLIKKLK